MAISTDQTGRSVPLEQIRVPDNVCELEPEHVRALAGSIALQDLLVPVVERATEAGFELVAGFHRVVAALSIDLAEAPVVLRGPETEDADRAVKNIARKQLNPTRKPSRGAEAGSGGCGSRQPGHCARARAIRHATGVARRRTSERARCAGGACVRPLLCLAPGMSSPSPRACRRHPRRAPRPPPGPRGAMGSGRRRHLRRLRRATPWERG